MSVMRRVVAACSVLVAGCAPVTTSYPSAPVPRSSIQSTSPSSSAHQPAPSPTPAPRSATVNVSGDLLWHNTLWTSAAIDARTTGTGSQFDFLPQLEALRPHVEAADLAVCHSEVPFAQQEGPFQNYPLFAAPPHAATAISEVGWDLCTTASNHSLDQGWDGLVHTIDVHESAGILTAGTYRTEAEATEPIIFTTGSGVKIAIVSQTYGLNGIAEPEGKGWSVDLMDSSKAIADAERAREGGADIVGVHMHAGDEYSSEVNQQQRTFAEEVTRSPAVDFVFGQHAHVPQPIDRVNDKWVVYGTGNLIAASGPAKPRTYDGYLAEIVFTEQTDGSFASGSAEFIPTFITPLKSGKPARVLVIADALRDGSAPADQLAASAARTRATVLSLGPAGLTERE